MYLSGCLQSFHIPTLILMITSTNHGKKKGFQTDKFNLVMCDVQKLNFPVNVLTFGLKAKNFKFINYSLVETAHARCVWLLWKKPFYCPTLFPGYLGSGERETLGTRLANVEHLNHNSTLFRATRKNIIFNLWSLMCRPLYMNSTVFNFEKNNSHITCK